MVVAERRDEIEDASRGVVTFRTLQRLITVTLPVQTKQQAFETRICSCCTLCGQGPRGSQSLPVTFKVPTSSSLFAKPGPEWCAV